MSHDAGSRPMGKRYGALGITIARRNHMATLDDNVLERLRELNGLRDRARDFRERGRKALAKIPSTVDIAKLENHDLSDDQWVSGRHPIDLALVVRLLNNQGLRGHEFEPCCAAFHNALKVVIEKPFALNSSPERSEILANGDTQNHDVAGKDSDDSQPTITQSDVGSDPVPVLTAARAMHALVGKSETVFSTATMLCYYQIVRELYLATFPNWIIGAARAGEGGRVSAFVTGECVRAVLAFQNSIRDTLTFFKTTKKLYKELERLEAIPRVDDYLKVKEGESHWPKCFEIEVERIVLDWYAANNLRRNVIALNLWLRGGNEKETDDSRPESEVVEVGLGAKSRITTEGFTGDSTKEVCGSIFGLDGEKIELESIKSMLKNLPSVLRRATSQAVKDIDEARKKIVAFRESEAGTTSAFNRVDRRRFDATSSAHAIALGVVAEALDQAQRAAATMILDKDSNTDDLPTLLDKFIKQYVEIYKRIGRVIEPAKRYIQDVLNRELAHAANSAKFDAGELLFAAASYGAITKWKQNEQMTEARKLLVDLLPEDGKFQTSRPIQSTSQGLQLMPIAFEMTRCFAQLIRKDFGEDLDPNSVRKLLNLFEENPIELAPGVDDRIGWNFSGAPESQKPSVWVTAVGVFALDRTIRMLNERINAIVLRHFNVDLPKADNDPWTDVAADGGGKMNLSKLMNTDYELQSAFEPNPDLEDQYRKIRHRMDNIPLPIRLQQMRAHLTRAVLPNHYSAKSKEEKYQKAYNGIFYGPPGTGKTTFAEALATTARVPLVRLSPSDLMVQGSDVIESRARAIFDSLSMLTQAVIFLDEFEPVVRTRSEPEGKSSEGAAEAPVTPPDPPEFRFLVTGMLPKLTKLNDVAAVQSVVYLLATNYLVQIDDAAKRAKRFDLHLPIYNPDPMSRLIAFFYQLISVLKEEPGIWRARSDDLEKSPESFDKLKEDLRKEVRVEWEELEKSEKDSQFVTQVKALLTRESKITWQNRLRQLEKDPAFWTRVREAIEETEEVSAQSLATVFFSPKASKNFVTYVRYGDEAGRPGKPTPDQANTGDKKTPVERDIQAQRAGYENSWKARQAEQPSPEGS